jgi:hypothetical protein
MINKVCIKGVVKQVTEASALGTNVRENDTMTGHYVYDMSVSSTTTGNPNPCLYNCVGNYPGSRLFYDINGFTFQTNPRNLDMGISITDGILGTPGHIDQILLASTDSGKTPFDYNTPVIDHGLNTGIIITEIGLYFNQKGTASVITNCGLDNVPTSNADLAKWDTSWFINGPKDINGTSHGFIQGYLTEIHTC